MTTRPNPTVGATLFSRQVDHRLREEPPLEEVTVTKVGRRYFYCKGTCSQERTFHLNDWRQELGGYSPDRELYATRQAYLDEMEAARLRTELQRYLDRHRLPPLDALRIAHRALLPPASAPIR